jgi:hypothetical protein
VPDPAVATAAGTWASYAGLADSMPLGHVYEKSDLYSLGVMLSRFRPLKSSGVNPSGAATYLYFVRRLLLGGSGSGNDSLWRTRAALSECRALLADPRVASVTARAPKFRRLSTRVR